MANIIGELSVLLDAVIKPFTQKMGEAVNMVDDSTSRINRQAASMGKGFDIATVAVGGFAGAIAVQSIGAAVGVITDITSAIVDAGAAAETSKVAFTTLLGSASEAEQILKRLQEFAAKTPFEFPELQAAARNMLAFGFSTEEVLPMLRTIGDAVSALGGGAPEIDRVTRALGQMQAKGKVSAEEMQQLAELGIPAWKLLADEIGVSIPTAMQRAEDGAIDAATAIDAILRGMSTRFAGGMEAQSQTLAGMWSNIKDQLAEIARILGTMMVPALKEMLVALGPAVQEMGELVKQFRLWNEERKGTASRRSLMAEEVELANKGFQGSIGDIRKALTGLQQTQQGMWAGYMAGVDSGTLKTERFGSSAVAAVSVVGKSASETKVHVDELQKAVFAIFSEERSKQVKEQADRVAVAIGGIGGAAKITEQQVKSLDQMMKEAPADWDGVLSVMRQLESWKGPPAAGVGAEIPGADLKEAGEAAQQATDEITLATADAKQKSKENIEAITGIWKENAKEWGKATGAARQEVSTIINDLGRDLARAIIHWKGFKEAGLSALEAVGEAITRQLINKLVESTGIIDKVMDGLLKVLGLGGKGGSSSGIPGVSNIPGVGKGGAGGAGGAASAAMSGAMGWIGVGASVVSAVSDIIGNFQAARQETTLNAIEWNTRKSSIHLEYLLQKANETWPYLQHINNTLWTPGAGGGVGGGTQITVNYTGDVRSLTMMIVSELQRMGLRVAPA